MTEQSQTVLVVDDSRFVRDTFSRFLANEGFRMIPAPGGAEALEVVDRELVDLVILDIRMPGISGLEVLRSLRQQHSPEELPVIMATSVGQSEEVVTAFRLGANDYVTKPLDFPVLLARMETQLRSKAHAAATAPMPEMEPGTVLEGRYRLESLIGQGQFGVVYRATHRKLRRQVAVKMLRTGAEHDRDLQARFHREGMSACRIRHPNAVSVLDFSFTPTGLPFMVMELLEGHSLADELSRCGRLAPRRSAEILLPICEVLTEAHDLGIVHRDIKPANIFLHRGRRGEVVKVLDFGLAKLIGEEVMTQKLTLEGVGPGTPLYMAPERFCERPYDGGADVYSLGIMLYEMLAGQPPFDISGGNPLKMALMHLSESPRPLAEIAPELPAGVEAVVLRALAKNPEERPSAPELAGRFTAALGLGTPAAAAARPSCEAC